SAKTLELILAELEARKVRDVQELIAVDCHPVPKILPEMEEAPCRGPFTQ
ncbi:MAG: hypothetical protein QOE43_1277, partial [Gaiellaceae bacterium]|nr:hypothetical protein [Gaiellaceae bacterium]